MAFTYDITTDRGKVRRVIGDAVENHGILPNQGDTPSANTNFSDAEIDYFLEAENSHVMKAAALALENTSNAWTAHAGLYKLGPETEDSRQGKEYAKRALALRQQYGYTHSAASAGFSVPAPTLNSDETS